RITGDSNARRSGVRRRICPEERRQATAQRTCKGHYERPEKSAAAEEQQSPTSQAGKPQPPRLTLHLGSPVSLVSVHCGVSFRHLVLNPKFISVIDFDGADAQ